MKSIKAILVIIILLIVSTSFSQCTSSKSVQDDTVNKESEIKLQDKVPFKLGEVNYQLWAAGIQEGGSGINVHFTVLTKKSNVVFDSLFFRGLKSKIAIGKMDYFARLVRPYKSQENIQLESNAKAEERFPFQLKDNECVLSYKQDNAIYYYKIENLIEKQAQNYPSSRLN